MRARNLSTALLWAALAGSGQLLMSAPAQAQATRYELDPDHITVAFLVDHVGYAKVLGLFRSARGSYRFDEAGAALSEVRIEVETASVFTNQRKRDDHLKGPDFLNSGEFPKMVFTASSAKRTGDRTFEIGGQLELLGKSQPLTLQATWNKSAESPLGGPLRKPYVMGVSARGSFKRSAYGMTYAVSNGWVGDEVPLIIEFEAVRQ
ncbi:YceI family protein [Hydrogenophaga sp.]|uniref:YceI family protein n=1 Tax=Hydrogenophaga sp. TaxID=1904254 RepID=UPI0027311DE5|nr:YceI family protein [Hydrogenophaga sp.]MDP2016287.1 YceI family protein [Hydrogenophaga sp.]MDP3165051.1 YceI family protein [Hydrogenophaga sp.]